ncbi:DNA polymerase III subunit gamma/tau [Mycoplasma sp. Pen4]|uniref:DNA polymerase III subunit gamma/tau n=1 Tax=Mycoplasma sp. Pen4 TaxID=640330 RepID=UPI0016542B5E|nr:DNA polymerase III subunit gamma/tau [Mycoplasma sp. Pen4]QNM93625.1 DNA polymerase III subunit gamma/tau [Mycoplasma sp. Pen4]
MSYKALYRKYRPQTFNDVVGQDNIITTLKNILQSRKIGHAYLFSGPKGTGKTSVAKIFANVINCMHQDDVTIACDYCRKTFNTNLDVIEMDAASNNGVDEIRDLKEKIEQAPINSKFKIYIIDEVHMLTKSAFNALLKTLEEPPRHAIFIFATTDPQKIPLTIRSRVQTFNFNRMNEKNIVSHLKNILEQENISYTDEALKVIARLSSGGMRDALSIADQASSFNNHQITLQDLYSNFGILSTDEILETMNIIINSNVQELIAKVQSLQQRGIDPQQFVLSLITFNKEKIILNKTQDTQLISYFTDYQLNSLQISLSNLFKLTDSLYEILTKIQKSEFPFEIIELGLLKLTQEFEPNNDEVVIHTPTQIAEPVQKPTIQKPITPTKIVEEVIEEKSEPKNEVDLSVKHIDKISKTKTEDIQQHTTESILDLVSNSFKFNIKRDNKTEIVDNTSVGIDLINSNNPSIETNEEITTQEQASDLEEIVQARVQGFLNEPNKNPFLASKIIKEQRETKEVDLNYKELVDENNKTQSLVNEMLDKTREFLVDDNEHIGDDRDIDTSMIDQLNTGETDNFISTREIDINKTDQYNEILDDTTQTTNSYNDLFQVMNDQTQTFEVKRSLQEYQNDARWIHQNRELNKTTEFKNHLKNLDVVLMGKENFKEQAELFKKVKILMASDRFITVTSEDNEVIKTINAKSKSKWLQEFVTYVFGSPYKHIYALTHDKVREIQKYIAEHGNVTTPIKEPEFLTELEDNDEEEWFLQRAKLFTDDEANIQITERWKE